MATETTTGFRTKLNKRGEIRVFAGDRQVAWLKPKQPRAGDMRWLCNLIEGEVP